MSENKCPNCGSFKWDYGKKGESSRALILVGIIVFFLGGFIALKLGLTNDYYGLHYFDKVFGALLIVVGIIMRRYLKLQCANCGYQP
jgi:hypothetical protein